MKIKILYLVFALFSSSMAMAQGETSWGMGLRGAIKTLHQYTYNSIEKDGILEKAALSDDGHQAYIFERSGHLLETVTYNKDETYRLKTVHKYDEKHNLLQSLTMNESAKQLTKIVYKCDDNNFTKEAITYDENNKMIQKVEYNYNEHKNCNSQYIYVGEWEDLTKVILMSYDVLDKMILQYEEFFHTNKIITKDYTYDEAGRELRCEIREGERQELLTLMIETTYDDMGNAIEIKETALNKKLSITTYKYEYDEKGNWIKAYYSINNKPEKIIERQIVYY
jgi:hypothetical protein